MKSFKYIFLLLTTLTAFSQSKNDCKIYNAVLTHSGFAHSNDSVTLVTTTERFNIKKYDSIWSSFGFNVIKSDSFDFRLPVNYINKEQRICLINNKKIKYLDKISIPQFVEKTKNELPHNGDKTRILLAFTAPIYFAGTNKVNKKKVQMALCFILNYTLTSTDGLQDNTGLGMAYLLVSDFKGNWHPIKN